MGFVRFIKKLGLFLLILAAIFIPLELVARSMFPTTQTVRKLAWVEAGVPGIEIGIFGTSHILAGVNPRYLQWPGFNFADSSEDLYYGELLFRRNLDRMPNLKAIVIGVDPFSFGYDEAGVDADKVIDFLSDGYPPRRPMYLIQRLQRLSWLVRYRTVLLEALPAYLRGHFDPNPVSETDALPPGFTGTSILLRNGNRCDLGTLSEAAMTVYGQERAQMHHEMYNSALRGDSQRILRSWIDEALNRGVRVLLVTPPTYVRYYEHLDPGMVAEFHDDLASVLHQYAGDRRVQYRSYCPDPSFPREEFSNGDHLNAAGARRFTELLNQDITTLLTAAGRTPSATVRNSRDMNPETRPRP